MPVSVTVAAALDKGKLASSVAYIALLEIDILDSTSGAVIETVRLAHNNENFTHQGNTYVQMPFDFNVNWAKDELPQITLTLFDLTQAIHGKMEEYRGGTDFPVRLKIVSSVNPDLVEVEEHFTIMEAEASSDSYGIQFTLGAENPLALRWPVHLMFRNRCRFKYKGEQCQYAGGLPSCDFTLDGPNGCEAHNNTINFGGYRGIRRRNY